MLTRIPYGESIGKRMQTSFYGLNHRASCGDGEIYDSLNLSLQEFPLLTPRKKRGMLRTLTKPNGLGGRDKLCWVDGTEFYYDGVKKGDVTDSRKSFAYLGAYIIIMPDKSYYNVVKDEFGSLEATYKSGAGQITIKDSTYAEVDAKANTITTTGDAFPFSVGEAVEITGCNNDKNNITPIIREMTEDKKTLIFYENTFTLSGTSYTEPGSITVERKLPDMDFIFSHDNRLWGCKGDTIYASKLGSPFVWMDYDGLANGSWAVDVGSAGDFTACCEFAGFVIFFKEHGIHKVYGDKPSNFQVMAAATLGVKKGCDKSLSIAGETLFYRSYAGFVRYNGGFPYIIDDALGEYTPDNAVAGSDGIRYYVEGETKDGTVMLVYDTRTKQWTRENANGIIEFAKSEDGLYFLADDGSIFHTELQKEETPEDSLTSYAEFGSFYEATLNRKGLCAIHIRAECAEGAEVNVSVDFDGAGRWQTIGKLRGGKKMYRLPLVTHRCDFFSLRLDGVGDYKIYTIGREFHEGSDRH